jgi:hypothetical protein
MTVTKHSDSRAGLPRTAIGKWAGGLFLVFLGLLAWTIVGSNGGSLEAGSALAEVAGSSMMIAGVATVVTAAVDRFKFKDRSLVIIVAMVVPALVIAAVVFGMVTEP